MTEPFNKQTTSSLIFRLSVIQTPGSKYNNDLNRGRFLSSIKITIQIQKLPAYTWNQNIQLFEHFLSGFQMVWSRD